MRTINLQTVYQLVITALLLGACLGLLGQRLPWLGGNPVAALEQNTFSTPLQLLSNSTTKITNFSAQAQDMTTSNGDDATVQVEVEVHSRGNANAQARALGPSDTEVKANTEGEGDGRSVAYVTAPEAPRWATPTPTVLPTNSAVQTSSVSPPTARVIEALVNLRSAPNLAGVIVATASRGQEFTIVGRDITNVWRLVCCYQNEAHWIHSSMIQVTGDSLPLPVVASPASANTYNTQLAPAAPPLPTAAPAQNEFMLTEQAQFEERIRPRIFLYVYAGDEGLAGYTLQVRKDGRDLPVAQSSIPGVPGYTWPIPNERQRSTNLKVEFPDVNPAGVWEVQLSDATGRTVGPVATFHLQPNDANQEMYVMYRKR